MKDMFKRLLCVLMALMMVMALCACGEGSDDDDDRRSRNNDKTSEEETTTEETTTEPVPVIVGEWEAVIDVAELYSEMFGLDVEDLEMTWTMEFAEDGTYTFEFGIASFLEQFKDVYWDVLVMAVVQEAGCTESEAEDALIQQVEAQGMTKDEFLDAMMEEQGMTEDAFGDASGEGEWELDGDELDIDGDILEIEFDGDDEFTVVDCDISGDYGDIIEEVVPLVFERV